MALPEMDGYNMLFHLQNFQKLSQPRSVQPPDPMSPNYAYVTLLTQASYLAGVLVLDQSLRSVGSQYPLVVMVTPSLPDDVRAVLRKRRIRTRDVDSLQPPDRNHTLAEHDVRFADTWTKLRV